MCRAYFCVVCVEVDKAFEYHGGRAGKGDTITNRHNLVFSQTCFYFRLTYFLLKYLFYKYS